MKIVVRYITGFLGRKEEVKTKECDIPKHLFVHTTSARRDPKTGHLIVGILLCDCEGTLVESCKIYNFEAIQFNKIIELNFAESSGNAR